MQRTTNCFPLKERRFSNGWMEHEGRGIKNQLYEDGTDEYPRLLRVDHVRYSCSHNERGDATADISLCKICTVARRAIKIAAVAKGS